MHVGADAHVLKLVACVSFLEGSSIHFRHSTPLLEGRFDVYNEKRRCMVKSEWACL